MADRDAPSGLNAPVTDEEREATVTDVLRGKSLSRYTVTGAEAVVDALVLERRKVATLREAGDELVRRLNESDVCPVCRMDDEHAYDMPCSKLAYAILAAKSG